MYDVKTGARVFQVGDELDTVLAADINNNHTLIALGGPRRIVRVYSAADGALVYELKKHTDWITSLEFSPDGVLLATGDRNGGLFVWEADAGREYQNLAGHTAAISDVSWRLDSNVLASSSEDGTIKLWEMDGGKEIKNIAAHAGGVTAVEYTRDGRLASTGRDRLTKVWDPNGAVQRGSVGNYVYVVAADHTVSVRTVETGPSERGLIAITKGLKPGEVVVEDGVDKLREGSAVEVITHAADSAAPAAAKAHRTKNGSAPASH